MENTGSVELTRDCEATQVPAGTTVVLPAGTQVDVVQTLGGSYTVRAETGLFRIAQRDASALGLTSAAPEKTAPVDPSLTAPLDEETVWKVLKTCYDPEIPVNIVDLGLVYELQIEPASSGGSRVSVKMTLTAPGCGMGATIAGDAQQKIQELPGVAEADVQIVWDPPWHHSRISPAGRSMLGLE